MRRYGRYSVKVSRPDKVLFPEVGLTKSDLCDYYESVAEWMLPHLRDRPLSLQRFPDGVASDGFYQKDASDWFPDWLDTVEIPKKDGTSNCQVVVAHTAALVYLASQATITLHVWTARADDLRRPDRLVFDLDPPGDDFDRVRRAAHHAREVLAAIGLEPYLATTGSSGLHVVTPIRREHDFDVVHEVAQKIARVIAARAPDELTTEFRKKKRRGRLFLDTRRNLYAQTVVAPYSVRPRTGAPVATPLAWGELDSSTLGPRSWHVANVVDRLRQHGDPWRAMGRRARGLAAPRRQLAKLLAESDS